MATIKLETFPPGTSGNTAATLFASKLQYAVTTAVAGTVIDCTSYSGNITLTTGITITKSVTLLFGNLTLTMKSNGNNMFNVVAPNVKIVGVSRSTKTGAVDGKTAFVLTGAAGGYHIFCGNNSSSGPSSSWASYSGLILDSFDCLGVQSAFTNNAGVVSYTNRGTGGIQILEGNPDQSNTNVQNVQIRNVFINGTTNHGIMIHGGMTSKLQNCRVSAAGGHAYYIAGGSTSMSLDTCYATSATLAGFCIHNTSYSTLTNCASDSCGVGYWLRNATTTTLVGCGAEASVVRSQMPNNLGITVPSSAGTITINDIGSDNVNFIRGASYFISGGEANTLVNPYSKDPGNRAGEATYLNRRTAHLLMYSAATKMSIINPYFTGTSPLKYDVRLEALDTDAPVSCDIQYTYDSYDPINPDETPDTDMLPVANILDQGTFNMFGISTNKFTWGSNRLKVYGDSLSEVNNLYASDKLVIPVGFANPADPTIGQMYYNTGDDKLYVYNGSAWTLH